jgi:hypothetical protein
MSASAGRPKGTPKSGGRKKGTPNKRTTEFAKSLAASGRDPVEFMLTVMTDEGQPLDMRMDAAKAAAPYVRARMMALQKIALTDPDGIAPYDPGAVTDERRIELLMALIASKNPKAGE